MDLKKIAAEKALELIAPHGPNVMRVGLGAGSTIAYLVELLAANPVQGVELYTSADATAALLNAKGLPVHDVANVARLDLYLDGCDQLDRELNALKSGGGIHTSEKLLARMAREFVLLGDTSKYVERLDTRYPICLEVLTEAVEHVRSECLRAFPTSRLEVRRDPQGQPIVTKRGHWLADVRFGEMPELAAANQVLKFTAGVVETSLFYRIARKAILAGPDGVTVLTAGSSPSFA
ncbi:ribose 5-phosphate isomerase A [Pendulispora brunnea]|uniref:Ribose 5-phosphate isomerase A n=1 Tax=Pendulispora brunnea TaxID=2905690 RepID=A0ABZ2K6K7_9BACT